MTKEQTRRAAVQKKHKRLRAMKASIVAMAIASISLFAVLLNQG